MKQTQFFRNLLRDSLAITWKNKAWWFLGFIAVFLSGSLGYQLITRNIYRLAQPNQWVEKWRWLSEFNPGVLLGGQWTILTTDPKGWFALLFGWSVVLLLLAVLFVLSAFALDIILSGLKLRRGSKLDIVRAVVEAKHHIRPLVLTILGVYVVSNLLLLALSIPVTVATLSATGFARTAVYALSFIVLFLASVLISLLSIYTLFGIVFYDYNIRHALAHAWRFLRSHWVASLTLLVLQIVIIVVATLLLVTAISLILIPIIIAGYLLVAYEQYDLTAYLPQLVFYSLIVIFTFFGAAYTVFQLACWSLLYTQPTLSDDRDLV